MPRTNKRKITKKYQDLYSPNRPGSKAGFSSWFANPTIARKTLRNIEPFNLAYQKQVVVTMYNRAKYHTHRTLEMQDAMRVYSHWMKKHDVMINKTKTRKK